MNPAETLLENILAVAEDQIKAAKSLDASLLEELTLRRQDLLFELELEKENNNITVTPKLEDLKKSLDATDERLMALLSTVVQASTGARSDKKTKVYGANGRIRK